MAKCERIVHKSFFELFVLCRDNMVPYQDADYKLPKRTGQPGWSLIYVAFSDIYFIELFKLSCDHYVII